MAGKGLHIEIAPMAHSSRVFIDGVDISHLVQRVEIVADIHDEATSIRLSCVNRGTGEPFVIKGKLLDADPGEVS